MFFIIRMILGAFENETAGLERKKTLDEIKKQNEEIIKLLNK